MSSSNSMRKKILYICLLLANIALTASAQKLTIDDCLRMARNTYPLIKQYDVVDKISHYTIENANKAWLPQPTILADGMYVSQVSNLNLDVPSADVLGLSWGTVNGQKMLGLFHFDSSKFQMPHAPRYQYRAGLKVDQTLWDGGQIKATRNQLKAESEVKHSQLDVAMHDLDRKVCQVFLSALLASHQLELNANMEKELDGNYKTVETAYKNGLVTHADVDAVKVEILNMEKQRQQIQAVQEEYLHVLGILIGSEKELASDCLVCPDTETLISSVCHSSIIDLKHPELLLLDAQRELIDTRQKLNNTNLLPRIGMFVAGGLGNPGLNMFNDKFTTFYMAGVKLTWNLGGLYTHKNEDRIYELSRRDLSLQKDVFLFNSRMDLTKNSREIEKYKEILAKDNDITALRNNIKRASESKMRNGTITVADLMRDINAEIQARQECVLHEVELLKVLFDQKYTLE